jgi:hypothetical protein
MPFDCSSPALHVGAPLRASYDAVFLFTYGNPPSHSFSLPRNRKSNATPHPRSLNWLALLHDAESKFIRLCFWATIERHPRTREAADATVHVLSYALRIGAFTYQWLRPTRRVQFRPTSQDPTSRQKLGTVRTGHNRGVNSRSQGYSVR